MKLPFKVLVPIDFSDQSIEAFRFASRMAKNYGGKVVVVHVFDLLRGYPHFFEGLPAPTSEDILAIRLRTEKRMDRIIRENHASRIATSAVFITGDPVQQILGLARKERVSLIIMSIHGASQWLTSLLGSVAREVIKQAHCPVLSLNERVFEEIRKGEPAQAVSVTQS